jgi:hypothetical protein
VIPLPDIYKGMSGYNRDTRLLIYCSSIQYIYICVDTYIYIMEYYSALKKNEILYFSGRWVELEIIMLRKVNQVQKDKSYMFSLICGR